MKIGQKLAIASGELSESAGIFIDDSAGINIAEIRAKCRKLKLEKNIGLVVIDYLQLIQGSGNTKSREQEIAEISRFFKNISKRNRSTSNSTITAISCTRSKTRS